MPSGCRTPAVRGKSPAVINAGSVEKYQQRFGVSLKRIIGFVAKAAFAEQTHSAVNPIQDHLKPL